MKERDGNKITSHSSLLLPSTVSLTIDWTTNLLYWSDRDRLVIETYNIMTDAQEMVLSTDGLSWGIAIDPFSGLVA